MRILYKLPYKEVKPVCDAGQSNPYSFQSLFSYIHMSQRKRKMVHLSHLSHLSHIHPISRDATGTNLHANNAVVPRNLTRVNTMMARARPGPSYYARLLFAWSNEFETLKIPTISPLQSPCTILMHILAQDRPPHPLAHRVTLRYPLPIRPSHQVCIYLD